MTVEEGQKKTKDSRETQKAEEKGEGKGRERGREERKERKGGGKWIERR